MEETTTPPGNGHDDHGAGSTDGGHAKGHRYPYIRPEGLGSPERLAVDADDVEDFIEHFSHHDDHERAHSAERAKKLGGNTGVPAEQSD